MRLIPMYHIGEIARMLNPDKQNDDDYRRDVYNAIFYPEFDCDTPVVLRKENISSKRFGLEVGTKMSTYQRIMNQLYDAVSVCKIPEEFVIHRYSR